MQNLITSTQMKDTDAFTIKNQNISSLELMERAAKAFVKVFKKEVPSINTKIAVLCGKGNNGGDGLAIARLLFKAKYKKVEVYIINFADKESNDFSANLNRLSKKEVPISVLTSAQDFDSKADIFIDAVLGAGLNKALSGEYEAFAQKVNDYRKRVIAVDVPTGFAGEGQLANPFNGIKADLVVSFQRPKINFFFPESVQAMNRFKVVDIGLSEDFIEKQPSSFKLTDSSDIGSILKIRKKFTHKGTYGHALIVAGSEFTMGASILSAKGCLLTGAGLTTAAVPGSSFSTVNIALPEVMTLKREDLLSQGSLSKYTAIAVGPGMGTDISSERVLEKLIIEKQPLVIDADALSILSSRSELLDQLAEGTILTPHMKEFDRIFGAHADWFSRVETAMVEAQQRKVIIILKNQYTFVCLPTGEVLINPTGSPAMASGGMGDVLTGMVVSLLAQSYTSTEAAIIAVFLHGKVGEVMAQKFEVVVASQLANKIPKIFKKMRSGNRG